MKNKTRVLIINRCNTDNLGDQMIGFSMKKLFSSLGAIVDTAEYSNFTAKSGIKISDVAIKIHNASFIKNKLLKINCINEINWKRKNKKYMIDLLSCQYDYIIFGGG